MGWWKAEGGGRVGDEVLDAVDDVLAEVKEAYEREFGKPLRSLDSRRGCVPGGAQPSRRSHPPNREDRLATKRNWSCSHSEKSTLDSKNRLANSPHDEKGTSWMRSRCVLTEALSTMPSESFTARRREADSPK